MHTKQFNVSGGFCVVHMYLACVQNSQECYVNTLVLMVDILHLS